VAVAQNSTPGDKMFAIKRIIEKSQGLIMTDSSQRVELASVLLGNRVDELQKIVVEESQLKAVSNRQEHINKVALAVGEIKRQLNDVNNKLEELKTNNSKKKTAVAALVLNKKIKNYRNELKQIKAMDNSVDGKLEETLDQVGEINANVLTVIVDKQQKGELQIDKTEIKNKLADHISDIEEKVVEVEKILVDNSKVETPDFTERTNVAKKKIEDAKKAIINNEFGLVLTLAKDSNDILKILYGDIYKKIHVVEKDVDKNKVDGQVKGEKITTDNGEEINTDGNKEGVIEGVDNGKAGNVSTAESSIVSEESVKTNKPVIKSVEQIKDTVKVEEVKEFDVGIK
jgi:hypothetical protein